MEEQTTTSSPPKSTSKDLEELISLAETISADIDKLEEMLLKLRALRFSLFMLACIAASMAVFILLPTTLEHYKSENGIIFAFISLGCLILFFRYTIKLDRTLRHMKSEKKLLDRLFSMIYELTESLSNELSLIQKAYIEIKLSRLKFSVEISLEELVLDKFLRHFTGLSR